MGSDRSRWFLHEGAALAYIGEKSRGIFFSSWDLTTPLPPQENFSPSRGILKMARVSPHFENCRPYPTPSMRTSPHLVGSHEMGRNSHHFENDENPRRNLISSKYTVKLRFINKISL